MLLRDGSKMNLTSHRTKKKIARNRKRKKDGMSLISYSVIVTNDGCLLIKYLKTEFF